MFNKNQLLIGTLVFDVVIQHYALQIAAKENIRRGKIIDYLISMIEKHDIPYEEFDVIALSDFGVKFKEIDASA